MNRLFSAGKILCLCQARFWQNTRLYLTVFYTCMNVGQNNLTTVSVHWQILLMKLTLSCDLTAGSLMWIFLVGFIILILIISGAEWQNVPALFFLSFSFFFLWRPMCSFVFFIARLLRNISETSLLSLTVQFMETAYRHWPSTVWEARLAACSRWIVWPSAPISLLAIDSDA